MSMVFLAHRSSDNQQDCESRTAILLTVRKEGVSGCLAACLFTLLLAGKSAVAPFFA